MSHFDLLLSELKNGTLLTSEMLTSFLSNLNNKDECVIDRGDGTARARLAQVSNDADRKLDEKTKRSVVKQFEAVYVWAEEKVQELHNALPEEDRNRLLRETQVLGDIPGDLVGILYAVFFKLESPYLNWIWLHYRAGRLPWFGFPVEGSFDSFWDITRERAVEILDEGERNARAALLVEGQRKERLTKELASVSGMLPADLLRECVLESDPVSWIALSPAELSNRPVPAAWRELLEAQSAKKPIPWEKVWGPVKELLPAVLQMLSEKCLGVAVLALEERDRTTSCLPEFTGPLLAYVFEFNVAFGPYGRAYAVYVGGSPLPLKPHDGAILKHFPESVKTFYHSVHDGWCDSSLRDGLQPAGHLQLLVDRISDTDEFENDNDKPFSMHDMVNMVETGNGDAICLDLKRSTKDKAVATYFYHEVPDESRLGLDFWETVNTRIRKVVIEGFIPTAK